MTFPSRARIWILQAPPCLSTTQAEQVRDLGVVSHLSNSASRVAQAACFTVDLSSSQIQPARFPPQRKTAQSTRKIQANPLNHFPDRPPQSLTQGDSANLYASGDYSRLPYPSCMMVVPPPLQGTRLGLKSGTSPGSYDLDDPLGSPPFSQPPCISENAQHGGPGTTLDDLGSLAPLRISFFHKGRKSRDHRLDQTGTDKARISSI